MRKNTLRTNATCEHRLQAVKFWSWFWYSDAVRASARRLGFGMLPGMTRDTIRTRLLLDIKCRGKQVWDFTDKVEVKVAGVTSITSIFQQVSFQGVF